MFPRPSSGLSLMKVISGISKTLSIAQQAIPIYEQTKPMIANARKAFSVIKELNIPKKNDSPKQNAVIKKERLPVNTNNPSFFL